MAVPFLNQAYVNADASGDVAVTSSAILPPAQTAVLLVILVIVGHCCANKICEIPTKVTARKIRICDDIFIGKNA